MSELLIKKHGFKMFLPLSVFLLSAMVILAYISSDNLPFIGEWLRQPTGECISVSPKPWDVVPHCMRLSNYDNYRYITYRIISSLFFFATLTGAMWWLGIILSLLFYFFLGLIIDKILEYQRQKNNPEKRGYLKFK